MFVCTACLMSCFFHRIAWLGHSDFWAINDTLNLYLLTLPHHRYKITMIPDHTALKSLRPLLPTMNNIRKI